MDKNSLKKNVTPIEDLIAEDFGEIGSPQRDQFEMECDAFIIGEQLKVERLRAGLTHGPANQRKGTVGNNNWLQAAWDKSLVLWQYLVEGEL